MRDGCGFGAILGLAVLLFLIAALSRGNVPALSSSGLGWDATAALARQQGETDRLRIQQENETERERVRQQEETERAEEWNDTMQTGALYAAIAGIAIVWVIQVNRTRRKAIEVYGLLDANRPIMPPLQIANVYINTFLPNGGRIVDVNGIPMIADAERRRLIPLDVAQRRLADARLLPVPIDPDD